MVSVTIIPVSVGSGAGEPAGKIITSQDVAEPISFHVNVAPFWVNDEATKVFGLGQVGGVQLTKPEYNVLPCVPSPVSFIYNCSQKGSIISNPT